VTIDPLIVDVYPGDGHKDWRAFAAAGAPWTGVDFKATEGLRYRYDAWLHAERAAFIEAAGDRYGVDLFDGAYHYLTLDEDGAAQAELFVRVVELASGERAGTLWGMVDVERGGQRVRDPSRALVEDRTRAFAARYHQLTGRTATLYGGELLRSVGVTDRLGCGRSAIALYGARLPADTITRTGTDVEHLLLWQYIGADERTAWPVGYPTTAPGCGRVDISAMVLPGGIEAMRAALWAERPAA
jgi:GH25 family lysozyme M1 (1,4-beta-N-acetylmuramidase)